MTRHGLNERYAKTPCFWPRKAHGAHSADQAESGSISADQERYTAREGLKIQRLGRNMSPPDGGPRDADQTEIIKSPYAGEADCGFVPRGLSYACQRPKLFTEAEWQILEAN